MKLGDEPGRELLTDVRIIDCHAHFGHFAQAYIVCNDTESMLREMDRIGVEKLWLSSFLGIGPNCALGNELVAEVVRRHPDRFAGYAVVNPNRPEEVEKELNRCFQRFNMNAIKLHPAFHQYSIEGPAYRRVFDFAAKRRLPILSHDWGRPEFLEQLSSQYPEINFIIAHTGFWDGRSEFPFAGVVAGHENVFVDLAYSNIFSNALEQLVLQVGAAKILFGSDFPLHDLAYQLGRVILANIPDEEKRMILGMNMLRIIQ